MIVAFLAGIGTSLFAALGIAALWLAREDHYRFHRLDRHDRNAQLDLAAALRDKRLGRLGERDR